MKRFALIASLLFAAPAMAQQQQQYVPVAAVLLNKAQECEVIASSQYAQFQTEIETLKKQVADITTERDALKPKTAAPAAPKANAAVQPAPKAK